ncbi:MAG: hypothetical protein JSW58_10335 [Candidatus Latescibacterota bacterium]|nr:MAG: hypothetical protein JSW58_10335 [Candidatus Latescibacterota bacterium]
MTAKTAAFCLALVMCLLPSCVHSSETDEMTGLFPDIEGWTKDGDPLVFFPETLFEYINGAAEVYLSYDFEKLAALSYDSGEKKSVTVDVYQHRDLRNAFGIYSQEKPAKGNFLPIGTQGYYDKGVLNFFHGPHYVKIAGFYLEDEDQDFLTSLATEVAKRIGGEPAFPTAFSCFPESGKIENSEKYIAKHFLGHGFLGSAYTAEYETGDKNLRLFVIEAGDRSHAEDMLKKYFELVEKKGGQVTETQGGYRFDDPHRTSDGPVNLRTAGRYIWGLFTDDTDTAGDLLTSTEANLKKAGLVE